MEILNKQHFENNCWVGEVDASNFNSSKEARINAVTNIGSVCKGRFGYNDDCQACLNGTANIGTGICFSCGRDALNPNSISRRRQKLYDRLSIESAGKANTMYEFVPVKIEYAFALSKVIEADGNVKDFYNKVMRYSYFTGKINGLNYLLTNMRALLKAGIKEENIPFNTREELQGFKVIVGNIPWTSLYHIDRHRALVFNEESSRNKKYLDEVEFHYPSWWDERLKVISEYGDRFKVCELQREVRETSFKAEEATSELSDRRLSKFAAAGWSQDENTWDNLFNIRAEKTGTQNITMQVVDNIKKMF